MLDVRDFGAAGDGATDDTAAIQSAIDKAGKIRGTVFFPAGTYACGALQVPDFVRLLGEATWTYKDLGGSILRLNDESAGALIETSAAVGVCIEGLCLDGGDLGDGIHGIAKTLPEQNRMEDALRIERCHVTRFTGHGIRLGEVFCFTVRASHIFKNAGDGLHVIGCDGFVIDSWITANGGAGFGGTGGDNLSMTLTANRIEWNRKGGVVIRGGTHYNITGNYIDRSGGPGLDIGPAGETPSTVIAATGNVIYRSGWPKWVDEADGEASCHVRILRSKGVVVTGNTMNAGRDDNFKGDYSPRTGMVCARLSDSMITQNVLYNGALEALIRDHGSHGQGVTIRDNPGSLFRPDQHTRSFLA